MCIKINGISTPWVGLSWEYTERKTKSKLFPTMLEQKLKVAICSISNVKKYDKIKAKLKYAIEKTKIADVYFFEESCTSTLPQKDLYNINSKEIDVCIFLIDNSDGVTVELQCIVDIIRKLKIKALYYFCDEFSKTKTALEQLVSNDNFSSCKTVHKFKELSQYGAQTLINDILTVYRYFCSGNVKFISEESDDEIQNVHLEDTEKYQQLSIPKTTLKNVDQCRNYILKFALGYERGHYPDDQENTSVFDEWGIQFLPILFEGMSIKQFNVSMYLDTLENEQSDEHYQIVQIRWKAIQSYYIGDVEECLEHLKQALKLAKETNQPIWIVKDILIDIRNVHWTNCTTKNKFYDSEAQQELSESNEELYYPILDRIHDSLHEKYINGLYKKKTASPHTVTIGNNLDQYGEMLASSIVIAMYNGSLTHILLFYEKIRDFLFYLSCKYSDWNPRLNLYKLAIFSGKDKDIKGLQNSYPEILNNMTAKEAASIFDFCKNHPIEYQQINSQLLAFGAIGYFLDETNFKTYEKYIIEKINSWLNNDIIISSIGQNIFKCLSGISHRMSQDKLGEICCQFIDKHYSRWYIDMFKFINSHIIIEKMSPSCALNLIEHITIVLENDTEREQIKFAPSFLCTLRKQNRGLTDTMDKKIAMYLPDYYTGTYKLETTENEKEDMPEFIKQFTEQIKNSNDTQGKNGMFFGHGTRDIATVRSILLGESIELDEHSMDTLIAVVADTLLTSKEGISVKLDAISLLICIAVKYPDDYNRNRSIYHKIFEYQNKIETIDNSLMSTNINNISLKIGLQLLFTIMERDTYSEMLELMPLIQNDIPTTLAIARLIIEYLEITENVTLPIRIESIVLQNIMQWLHSENTDIRWYSTRIMIALYRNPENHNIINSQLIKLVDTDNVYIKNLIMRQIHNIDNFDKNTKEYIISKCQNDANYVVRLVCNEMLEKSKTEVK